jgi:uncharacterized protein
MSALTIETDEELRALLRSAKTIAVVGLSSDPSRTSHRIARYLQNAGYHIVPVSPRETEVLGVRAVPSLLELPGPVDIVDLFRRSDLVGVHVDEAIRIRAPAVWMQEGVIDEAAARRAHDAGLKVVMDRCIMVEHGRLLG